MNHCPRRSLLAMTVCSLVAAGGMHAQDQSPLTDLYPFDRYPVKHVYAGKPAAPKLITPTEREFQTVLRKGAAKGTNFAGHYAVVEWGCGSNCISFAVIDALTGTVYEHNPPVNDEYPCGLTYKPESTLFVVSKGSTANGDCKPHLYNWNGSEFLPIQP